MKNILSIIIIITFIIVISGCVFLEGDGQVVRTYTNNGSNNVTINIYKEPHHNFTIVMSNYNNITVVESFYLKKSYIKYSKKYICDYVKFFGNDTDLSLDINLESFVSPYETRNSDVHVYVYLPNNTNYTINYVDTIYFSGNYTGF
jgi:hypothetical protein